MEPYSHFDHRHNFCAWAAAPAAQRGLCCVESLKAAIEFSGLHNAIEASDVCPTDAKAYDDFHRMYARRILKALHGDKVVSAKYGHAAKLIAVYLKGMIVMRDDGFGPFASVIHPPIDRLLLQKLARSEDHRFSKEDRTYWRELNWTELDEQSYFKLIESLRRNQLDRPQFWSLERFWTVTS